MAIAMFRLRFVRDNTKIQFMRGRILGLVVSAVLSTASIILFFYPGLNYGIDFRGGISIEARTIWRNGTSSTLPSASGSSTISKIPVAQSSACAKPSSREAPF